MCTCSAVFIHKNKNIHSLSQWKIRVSRFLLLKSWKTNLWKWRYPISRTLTYKINCLVMAPRRPMCVCVGLQAMKQGQLKNIFAVLYEWLTPAIKLCLLETQEFFKLIFAVFVITRLLEFVLEPFRTKIWFVLVSLFWECE